MLLGVLFAGLRGFADLLPNHLPLVVLVLLDRRKQCRFLGGRVSSCQTGGSKSKPGGRAYLVFGKLGVMHVLVPVFLHAALCPGGERLWPCQPRTVVANSPKTILCLPWQSRPSCYQYPASASAEAPRPASRGYLSCSSWQEGGPVRRQPAAPPQGLLGREPEPEPEPGRAVVAADAAVAVGHAGHAGCAVGDVAAAVAAAGKGVVRLEEGPWEQPEQPVAAAAVPAGKPSHAEGRVEGRAEVHAGAGVEGAAAHAEERVAQHEEEHAEGRAGAPGRESAGVYVGAHAAARAEQHGPEDESPEPDVSAVRIVPAPQSGSAAVGVVEPAEREPGPAVRRGVAPAADAAAAGAGVVAATAAMVVWGMLDNPQAARAESCLVVAAAAVAAAAAAAEQRHKAVDCTSRHG